MSALWYPGAVRVPGPRGRVSGSPQPKHGAVYHSMVGSVTVAQTAHSWQFTIFKSGRVEQHYPVTAWCWHSGDRDDPAGDITNNKDLFGIEHEGGARPNYSEPLTARQLTATIELTKWAVAEGHIHKLTRTGPHRGLWEHREMRATACPSRRIPWATIIKRAQEDTAMTAFKVQGQGTTVWGYDGRTLVKYTLTRLRRDRRVKLVPNDLHTISQADFTAIRAQLGMDR